MHSPEEAEKSYGKAILQSLYYAELHHNLDAILQQYNKPKKAEIAYKEALRLKFNFAEAHMNLGDAYKEMVKIKAVEDSCRQAIMLTSDHADAYSNLGCTLYERGDVDLALKQFQDAYELDTNLRRHQLLLMVTKSR